MLQQDIDNRRQSQQKPFHASALKMPQREEKPNSEPQPESLKSSIQSVTTSASQDGIAALVAALIPGGLGILQRQEQNRALITQGSNLQSLHVPKQSKQSITITSGHSAAGSSINLVLPKRKDIA